MFTVTQCRKVGAIVCLAVLPAGCLPYTMSATAATVPRDSVTALVSLSSGSTAIATRSEYDIPFPTLDVEARAGIDASSDFGFRVTSLSGVVASYKRRVLGAADGPAVAGQLEAGVVHLGDHGLAGLSLIASGNEAAVVAPFVGARVLALAPFRTRAARSGPVAGGFAGMRFGAGHVALLPEVAVFRDPNQGERQGRQWFVVPALGVRVSHANRPRSECRIGRWPQC
jgi:hypothetical protein